LTEIVAEMTGVIGAVARFGLGCIVELDQPQGKFDLAVINGTTKGQTALRNQSPDGDFVRGMRVVISRAEIFKPEEGRDALVALEVKAA
jgi:hypothetical protein